MAEAPQLNGPISTPVPLPPPLGGVVTERPAHLLDDNQLASALNFVIREGVVTKRKGHQLRVDAGSTAMPDVPLTVWPYYEEGSTVLISSGFGSYLNYAPRLLVASHSRFYQQTNTAGALNDVTTTARIGDRTEPPWFTSVQSATAGYFIISDNHIDPLVKTTSATFDQFATPTTTMRAACGIGWKGHLLLGDVVTTADGRVPFRLQWSALGYPQHYTGTASTGTLDLIDDNFSAVRVLKPLNNRLFCYKRKGAYELDYQGAPFYFTPRMLNPNLHCISLRAVAMITDRAMHAVITNDDIIVWDGQQIESIGKDIRTDFFGMISASQYLIWAEYYPPTQELLIGIPSGSSQVYPNYVWIYNFEYKSWWLTNMDFIHVAYDPSVYPSRLIGCRSDGKVYELFSGAGDTTSGTTISASFQTKAYDFGDPARQKHLRYISGLIGIGTGTTTTVNITPGFTENPMSDFTFATANTSTLTATGGTKEPKADVRGMGKFISFRVTHSAASEMVQVHQLIPYIDGSSEKRKER